MRLPGLCRHQRVGLIIVEVDEGQHATYPAACDARRDFDTAASVAMGSAQKLVIVRYNPDRFRVGMATRVVSKKDRLAKLVATVCDMPEPSACLTRLFLFYDRDSEDAALPTIAHHWDASVRAVSRNA